MLKVRVAQRGASPHCGNKFLCRCSGCGPACRGSQPRVREFESPHRYQCSAALLRWMVSSRRAFIPETRVRFPSALPSRFWGNGLKAGHLFREQGIR